MRLAALAASLSLVPAAAAASETLRVPRISGGLVEARYDPPRPNRTTGVVLVVEDACELKTWGGSFAPPQGLTPVEVALNCAGGGPDLGDTVLDVLTVVRDLRANAEWWNGRLYLLGSGEGAAAASAAAGLLGEVEGVVLVDAPARVANTAPETPVLLVQTAAPALADEPPHDPRITRRRAADANAAFAEASRWIRRQDATRQAPEPQQQAESPPPAATPRSTARADAPPRRARAPTIQLGSATIAPKAAKRPPALRGALPATPGPRRGTGRTGPQ